ncbi:MAG: peptidoglycan-binding domain-containing protein [Coleofasciculaceae cyanobacterium]
MDNSEILVKQSLKYRDIIHEYCNLASQQTLTQRQAERIGEILQLAEFDPWFDFLISETDHILAHELGLTKEPVIRHQLQELKKSIDSFWCEQMIRQIPQQNCSKEVQKYLQELGLYDGLIDGYIGLRTLKAIELYKQGFKVNRGRGNCFGWRTRLVC